MSYVCLLGGHIIRGILRPVRACIRYDSSFRSHCVSVRRSLSSQISRPSSADLTKTQNQTEPSFSSLFENSKFARLLNPVGRKVKGEVIATVGSNLYVDFGCKLHAVVKCPESEKDYFTEGASVVLLLKDLEMTIHPLGASRDLSLLEAEAELCALA